MLPKLAALTGWCVCILALAGWLALAIDRHHLAGTLITATALVLLVVVPLLARRLNPPPQSHDIGGQSRRGKCPCPLNEH